MSESPNQEQIEAAVRGDETALAGILEHYRRDLERYVERRAGRVVLQKESAEDIVQSTCRELIARLPSIDFIGGVAGFRAWLFQSALRKVLDRHRYYHQAKRDIGREVNLLASASSRSRASLSALLVELGSPSSGVAADEELRRLGAAVDSLNEDQRLVVELAYFQACPQREIAELIGRSEVAVRSLLARALARIARSMLT